MRQAAFSFLYAVFSLFLFFLFGCGSGDSGPASVDASNILLMHGITPSTSTDATPITTTAGTAIGLGRGKYLSAAAYDGDNSIIPEATFSWSSSNPSVVAIDPETGLIRGVALGNATITATWEDRSSGPVRVTVLSIGGRGGAIGSTVMITVLDQATHHFIENATVSIGGKVATTDANGVATVNLDPAVANRAQDVHVFANGYATSSIYGINNDDLVLVLTPFGVSEGRLSGSVLGADEGFSIISAAGVKTVVQNNIYFFPSLPVSTRFFSASALGFTCDSQVQSPSLLFGFGFATGLGPVDFLHPIFQDLPLDSLTNPKLTTGSIELPEQSSSVSKFVADDLLEVQGYASFGEDKVLQTGMDVRSYCARFDQGQNDDPLKYTLVSAEPPGADSYWVQVNTDPSQKLLREKGYSFARVGGLTEFPDPVNITLMDTPELTSPESSTSISVNRTPTLKWKNTTGRDVTYYEVMLADDGTPESNRGSFIWRLIIPGTHETEITLPEVSKEVSLGSGILLPGNLVSWTVIAYDIPGYDYDFQTGGTLAGISQPPPKNFKP